MASLEPRPATRSEYHTRILRVLVFIQRNLDAELALDELARLACFSPFHFHRVFRGMVGEGVAEHVRRLRLERAAHQLKFGDDQVVRIALRAGFEAHESFTRAFAGMFGESPSAFRRRHRSVAYPPVGSGVHYAADGHLDTFHPAPIPEDRIMDITIERLSPRHVAFVRHTGPYCDATVAWTRLFAWAGPKRLLGPSMCSFGLCHDDPEVTAPDRIRYDACLVVPETIRAEGNVGIQDVPGGEHVTTVHAGPYETLKGTYEMLCGQWLPGSGRTLAEAPAIEFYLNDPRSTAPEQLRTKVCLRLA